MPERAFRMARTASLMVSTDLSSASKFHSSFHTGQDEIIIDSSWDCSVQKISSVINGINGCSSFSA